MDDDGRLRVWVLPEGWEMWRSWLEREIGGREIVLRRSRGYSEMVEWEGEIWLEE